MATFDAEIAVNGAINIKVRHADLGLVQARHRLKTGDPTRPNTLAESRYLEDWEVSYIMTHVNQQLHSNHGAADKKQLQQWLNGAISALHKHMASEEVETAQELPSPWHRPLDASTRELALREERMQVRRKLREDPAALAPSLTSEEALQQAQAEGLALLLSAENKTGYLGVAWHATAGVCKYSTEAGGRRFGSFATAEEAALRLAQAAARRVARLVELLGEEPGEDEVAGAAQANEALASGATLKEEQVVPPMPLGAFVKEEEILVPPMPPDAVHVKHEVLEDVRPDGGRPKKQRNT